MALISYSSRNLHGKIFTYTTVFTVPNALARNSHCSIIYIFILPPKKYDRLHTVCPARSRDPGAEMNLVKTAEICKMGKINSAIYRIERTRANFLKAFSSINCKENLIWRTHG